MVGIASKPNIEENPALVRGSWIFSATPERALRTLREGEFSF
jgi:hypothetical protein